jgi:hypothetical protein
MQSGAPSREIGVQWVRIRAAVGAGDAWSQLRTCDERSEAEPPANCYRGATRLQVVKRGLDAAVPHYVQNGIKPIADLMPLTINFWNAAIFGTVFGPGGSVMSDVSLTS